MKSSPLTGAVYAAILMALLTACSAPAGPPLAAEPGPMPAWSDPPALTLWDGGDPLTNTPPFPLFAVWSDGLVVRRVQGRLLAGYVPRIDVRTALDQLDAIGLFEPPLARGLIVPDGPMQRLAALHQGKVIRLDHDGTIALARLEDYGKVRATPQQAQEFVELWRQARIAIDRLTPDKLQPFRGERQLQYPGTLVSPRPVVFEAP